MKRFLLILVAVVAVVSVRANELDAKDSGSSLANITSENGKYSLSVGGFLNMKASYDFNGSIDHPDFISSLIPVPGAYNTNRRFFLDALTSRFEVKGKVKTEDLGDVELCLNMDFKGGAIGSYTPRLRLAYVSFSGLMIGRNYSTFCDVNSVSQLVDFEGPVVCPFVYATQIRYVKPIINDNWTVGGAVEYSGYHSAALGSNEAGAAAPTFLEQTLFMPDLIGYLNYQWDDSHVRLTGLYKSLPVYNTVADESVNLSGWGTQLSGSWGVCDRFKLYYSATVGEGISNYMQDTYGLELDATLRPYGPQGAVMTLMYGWQVAASAQLSEKSSLAAGYSSADITGARSMFADDEYRKGQFIYANYFYNLTSRVQLAAEYIWGRRTNNDGAFNSANRIYTMLQYNF